MYRALYYHIGSSDTPVEGVPLLLLFSEAAAEIQGGDVSWPKSLSR